MARPKGKIDTICQNPNCDFYLREEGKDIIKRGKYRTGHQRYYCKHCSTFFMETKGSPLYRKHLSKEQIITICKHLVEKNGIRSIERITGHHRDTIGHLLEDLAEHAEMINELLIVEVDLDEFELDEMWTFVKKNKRKLSQKAQMQLKKVTCGSSPA